MDRGSCQHQKHQSRRLADIQEEAPAKSHPGSLRTPETPTEAMEFLARSWSVSAAELSKALSNTSLIPSPKLVVPPPLPADDDVALCPANSELPVSSSSQSPLNGRNQKMALQPPPVEQQFGSSPPLSPPDRDDVKLYMKTGHRTMGGWLKDQREKRREEARARNAQVQAATAVAGVAAAVAAVAAAAFSSPGSAVVGSDSPSKAPAAMASAAALVASHCVEMAQAMGADRAKILTAIGSAVSVHTTGDIMALTAGAATGVLHWKKVSVYINANLQVVIKMKSMHIGGTFVKKKKSVVIGIDPEVPPWPGRATEEGSQHRAYFGIKTLDRMIEFECRNKQDKQSWVEGIHQMLHSHARMNTTM